MTIDTTRLRELLASASSRPWRSRDHLVYFSNVEGGFSLCGCPVRAENAALIADGINALPALLDEVERTERNRDMWKGQCERQAEQLERTRWQPIETAPRDGTLILLGARNGVWVGKYVPFYQSGYRPANPWSSMLMNHDHMAERYTQPTHWMPLPAPPAALSDPTTSEGA